LGENGNLPACWKFQRTGRECGIQSERTQPTMSFFFGDGGEKLTIRKGEGRKRKMSRGSGSDQGSCVAKPGGKQTHKRRSGVRRLENLGGSLLSPLGEIRGNRMNCEGLVTEPIRKNDQQRKEEEREWGGSRLGKGGRRPAGAENEDFWRAQGR